MILLLITKVIYLIERPGSRLIFKRLFTMSLWRVPNKEIVYRDISRYTYKKFYERLQRVANALESLGVKKDSKIGVLDYSTHRYLELLYAAPMIGGATHTVNIRLPPDQIEYTIKLIEDQVLFVRDEFIPLLKKTGMIDRLSNIKHWVVMSDHESASETISNSLFYEDLVNSQPTSYDFPEVDEYADAIIFFSSGTTGLPKAVHYSQRHAIIVALALILNYGVYPNQIMITSEDTILPLAPIYHLFAWGTTFSSILLGNKYVLSGKFDPVNVMELVEKEGVTIMNAVPTMMQMILFHPEFEKYKDAFRGLRAMVGGMSIPRSLAEKAKEVGVKINAIYGMADALLTTIPILNDTIKHLPEEEQLNYFLKVGIPSPLSEIRVVDSEGNDVPWDGKTIGEIIYRAPWVPPDYYKNPKATEKAWVEGYFHTGDLATVDEYGYISLVDRAKDAVKSGGEWIPTAILEEYITSHKGVKLAAVIGRKDEKWGERPIAFIVPKEEFKDILTKDGLREHLMKFVKEGKISKWWIPDEFLFVDSLPLTSVGKISKLSLRKMLEEGKV